MAVRALEKRRNDVLPLVRPLSLSDSAQVRRRFVDGFVEAREKFERQLQTRGTAFAWDFFGEKQACPSDVFLRYQRLRNRWFLVCFHDETRCFSVSGASLHNFVTRAWDEDADIYVFDDSYTWCVAFTHEDICVLKGKLPRA